jgi:hypothetical protein
VEFVTVKRTLPPAQKLNGPLTLMLNEAVGLTVTVVAFDVAEHPFD